LEVDVGMGRIEKKMREMGIEIPDAPEPIACYVPAVQTGNLVFVSGQGCKRDGTLVHQGKLGKELTVEEGYEAAAVAAINCLAILKAHLGNLDRIKRIVKLLGFVASAPGFDKQPYVINGASELLANVFGEKGRHARSAIGVNELPSGIPVEIEIIVEIE
jgi:enamine deaminase RidA (YjgF/YER057c/UK114 family)